MKPNSSPASTFISPAKLAPRGETLELRAGELRLTLAPEIGGAIAAFCRKWHDGRDARRTDWLRAASEAALASGDPLGMASFAMLPFCNRIRDGRAQFEGKAIRLGPNHPHGGSPHALHGIGWQRPWTVLRATPETASLGLEVDAGEGWPWRFSARQEFELGENNLRVELLLTNTGTSAMPAGVGHHPYFPRTGGTRLTSAVDGMWQTDAEVMPTVLMQGQQGQHGVVDRLAVGTSLEELDLDNNFTGWERRALIEWPGDRHGSARRLVMTAASPLDYFVVYSPPGKPFFCAEPVSQCTDWLNLMATHPADSLGGTRLAPGDSVSARMELSPTWQLP
jgi:aldose 1-epimerase